MKIKKMINKKLKNEVKTEIKSPWYNKTMGIGIEIRSPFHNNDKPIDKLIEKQTANNLFIPHTTTIPINEEEYCTCERCPHCGKKIRKSQPMWSVSF